MRWPHDGGAGGRFPDGVKRRVLSPATRGLVTTAAALALIAASAAWPDGLAAQGFAVNEHGTCTMARAGTGVAQPCDDGSALFFNPAGLTASEGLTLSAGGTLIAAGGDFTADRTGESTDLDNDPIPVPHLHAVYRVSDRLAAGVGAFVPYGLTTEWPSDTLSDFDGRFVGYDNSLTSIYVQPTLAYRLTDRLSVGAGLDVVIGSVELNQRLDLSRQPVPGGGGITFGQFGIPFHTDFADAHLEASGATGVGGNFGVRFEATDRLSLGARFLTEVTLDYEGDASFEQVKTGLTIPADIPLPNGDTIFAGTSVDDLLVSQGIYSNVLRDQTVKTSITMPAQLVAGLALGVSDRVTVLADYQWMGWSAFDRIPLDFEVDQLDSERVEDFEDTHAGRVGLELELTDAWTARTGYIYHTAAAPDKTVTPLLPEAARNEFTAGLGWTIQPGLEVNVAYQFIAQDKRRGRVREAPPGSEPTAALNSGLYSFNAHLVGTTLTLHF